MPLEDSNWKFERSSGYAGWRCTKCGHWIYMDDPKECDCTKEKQMAKPKEKKPVEKRLMIVHHSHRHGDSVYLIKASEVPSEEELVERLGIDFEPDREEFIEVTDNGDDPITEFP